METPLQAQNHQFVCPMWSCRQRGFEGHKSFLDHVKRCKCLPEAVYLCPRHHRAENFALHEKNSGLKRFYEIFKSFGRINRRDFSYRRAELEDRSPCLGRYGLHLIDDNPDMEANVMRNKELEKRNKELESTSLYQGEHSLIPRPEMPGTEPHAIFELYVPQPLTMVSEAPSHSKFELPAMENVSPSGRMNWDTSFLQADESQSRYIMPRPEIVMKENLSNTEPERSRDYMTSAGRGTRTRDRTTTPQLRLSTQTVSRFEIGPTEHSTDSDCLVEAESLRTSKAYAPIEVQRSISQGCANIPPNEKTLILDRDIHPVENLISPISPTSLQCADHHLPAMVSPLISPNTCINWHKPAWESQFSNTLTQCSPNHTIMAQGWDCSHWQSATLCTSAGLGISNDQQTSVFPNFSMRSQFFGNVEQCLPNVNPSEVVYTLRGHQGSSDEPSQIYTASGEMATTEACLRNNGDLLERRALSTRQYVQSLDQLMCMLDKLWQENLQEWPELYVLSDGTRSGSTFEMRLEILRECLTGHYPSEIQDLFRLMHLAYACAYMCHCDDASYNWDGFYKNVLQWASLISDKQDQYRFLKIADFLWSTPRTGLDIETQLQSTDFEQRPQVGQAKPARLYIPEATATASRHLHVVPTARDTLGGNIHVDIRDGLVLETCARFLDGKSWPSIVPPFVPYRTKDD